MPSFEVASPKSSAEAIARLTAIRQQESEAAAAFKQERKEMFAYMDREVLQKCAGEFFADTQYSGGAVSGYTPNENVRITDDGEIRVYYKENDYRLPYAARDLDKAKIQYKVVFVPDYDHAPQNAARIAAVHIAIDAAQPKLIEALINTEAQTRFNAYYELSEGFWSGSGNQQYRTDGKAEHEATLQRLTTEVTNDLFSGISKNPSAKSPRKAGVAAARRA